MMKLLTFSAATLVISTSLACGTERSERAPLVGAASGGRDSSGAGATTGGGNPDAVGGSVGSDAAGAGGTGGSASAGSAGSAGAAPGAGGTTNAPTSCLLVTQNDECNECMLSECAGQCDDCRTNEDCVTVATCAESCEDPWDSGYVDCINDCMTSGGLFEGGMEFLDIKSCLERACVGRCPQDSDDDDDEGGGGAGGDEADGEN